MFTWICPKCGSEVPPSYSECPNCGAKEAVPPEAAQQPPLAAPPETAQEPAQRPAVRPPRPPKPPRDGKPGALPGWALSILFALAFIATGLGVYVVLESRKPQQNAQAAPPPFQAPQLPSDSAVQAHPVLKFLEITGLRLTEDQKRRAYIQFVVVNHSAAPIDDLSATVGLKGVAGPKDQEPVGTFSFKTSLGPYEAKDMKAEIKTKLRVYELPDWQFLRPDIQVTSP